MTAVTVLLAAAIVLPALAAVLVPLLRRGAAAHPRGGTAPAQEPGLAAELTRARDAKRAVLEDLLALEADYRTGALAEADYVELRRQDETRALALIARVDELSGAAGSVVAAAPPDRAAGPATAEPAGVDRPAAASPPPRASWLTPPVLGALAVALLVVGVGGGYLAATRTGPDPVRQAAGGGGAGMPGPVMARVQEYRARLDRDPRDLEALLGMAELNLQRQDLPQAIDYYKRAIEADPGNPEALARLGMILGEAGHYSESMATLDRALARDPNHLEALWWKGQVQLFGLKDYGAAATTWERLAGLLPPGPDQDRAREALAQARAAAGPAPAPSAPRGAGRATR